MNIRLTQSHRKKNRKNNLNDEIKINKYTKKNQLTLTFETCDSSYESNFNPKENCKRYKRRTTKKDKKNKANPDELIKPGLISKTHNS